MLYGGQLYDYDPQRTLLEKVKWAVEAWQRKHGVRAEVCAVHPDMRYGLTDEDLAAIGAEVGVTVRSLTYCLRGWLWIGVESLEAMQALEQEAQQ